MLPKDLISQNLNIHLWVKQLSVITEVKLLSYFQSAIWLLCNVHSTHE